MHGVYQKVARHLDLVTDTFFKSFCNWKAHFGGSSGTALFSTLGLCQLLSVRKKKKRKSLTKCFTLLQLALSHQPIPHRVKNSCQAVIVFFFFSPLIILWAEAELIISETVFSGWLQTKNVISQRSAEVSETRFRCSVE